MNLHLLPDDKFTKAAVLQFEYFYPGENIYVAHPINGASSFSYIDDDRVINIDYDNEDFTQKLSDYIELTRLNIVFVHYLDESKAKAAINLVLITGCKCYWIFYGGDLYSILYKRKGYTLYDDFRLYDIVYKSYWKVKHFLMKLSKKDYFENFLSICNYICYWDKYDYDLLKVYYDIKAEYRFFAYYTPEQKPKEEKQTSIIPKQKNLILLGNNSNRNGNLLTVLKRISQLDKKKEIELLLPLSYGYPSDKKRILCYLKKHFEGRYTVLDNFIPYEEYLNIIARANSAIFGQRRQAAGGNIFTMIKTGAKVFLREDNNVLKLLRDNDCVVYSFEKDLNNIEFIMEPLAESIKLMNKNNCVLNNLSETAAIYMRDLFN